MLCVMAIGLQTPLVIVFIMMFFPLMMAPLIVANLQNPNINHSIIWSNHQQGKNILNYCYFIKRNPMQLSWHKNINTFLGSLIDSNVRLKWRQRKIKELKHAPWLATLWGVEGHASPWSPHPNGILSRDSQVGVPEFPQLGLSQLWRPITLRANLRLQWGLKKSCIPHWELSNNMSHATCTWGNRVDSRLLVVGSQTTNLIPGFSFGHNLCFRCSNGSCEPILNIYVSIVFQWYKRSFEPTLKVIKSPMLKYLIKSYTSHYLVNK